MIIEPYIHLPRDQYAHPEAPAEWWWHVGTLAAGRRRFGFEICATGLQSQDLERHFLLANIMLTDVDKGRHYQSVTTPEYDPEWAQADPTKPWSVTMGTPGEPGFISMSADATDPLSMRIRAILSPVDEGVVISFDLTLNTRREPLLVWGTGRSPLPVNPKGTTPLNTYNYYYSLTDLNAAGTVTIHDDVVEVFEVTGLTWMDHEYGAWPQQVTWTLQDIQLENGIRISNFTVPDATLALGQETPSHATVLDLLGNSTFYSSTVTPIGTTWTAPSGIVYYPSMLVKINHPDLSAEFTVTSLIPNQEFWNGAVFESQVYEGVASATGVYAGEPAAGTAWNEQRLVPQTMSTLKARGSSTAASAAFPA